VAFTDPSQIDSRVPTYAWHVAAGGAVDPERYQQYPGTPQTLSAWIAWFDHLPATDAAAPSPPRPGPPLPLALTTALGRASRSSAP
jgi:hypothetical protein